MRPTSPTTVLTERGDRRPPGRRVATEAAARNIDDELLTHISPAHSENVNFYGTIAVEVDTEVAKLDPAGYRPLRPRRPGHA